MKRLLQIRSLMGMLAAGLVLTAVVVVAQQVSGPESYRFVYLNPHVGQEATQQVDFDVDLNMAITQSGQSISSSRRKIRRTQTRTVTVTETALGQVSKARVTFHRFEEAIIENSQQPVTVRGPVATKTYTIARTGGKLVVTGQDGKTPPPGELAIVLASMGTIGEKNPLAGFLNDRRIAIGQTVRLPRKLAENLLGFAGAFGKPTEFSMKLISVRAIDGVDCAEFQTHIKAQAEGEAGQTMNMTGRFLLQVATCRAVLAEFSGPVAYSEKRGPAGGQYSVSVDGRLDVAIKTQYASRRR